MPGGAQDHLGTPQLTLALVHFKTEAQHGTQSQWDFTLALGSLRSSTQGLLYVSEVERRSAYLLVDGNSTDFLK